MATRSSRPDTLEEDLAPDRLCHADACVLPDGLRSNIPPPSGRGRRRPCRHDPSAAVNEREQAQRDRLAGRQLAGLTALGAITPPRHGPSPRQQRGARRGAGARPRWPTSRSSPACRTRPCRACINDSAHVRPGDARAGARGDAGARLPPERGGPRAGHGPVAGRSASSASTRRCTGRPRRSSAIERAAHAAGYFIRIVSLHALDRGVGAWTRSSGCACRASTGSSSIAPQEARRRGARQPAGRRRRSSPSRPARPGRCRSSPSTSSPARRARDAAPARARPPHRPAPRRPARLAGGPAAHRGLALGARRRRAPARPAAHRRLEPALGLPARPARSPSDAGRHGRCSSRTTRWRSGCCARCTSAAAAIPEAISVVGFDDIPEAEYFSPPLTTVRQDFDEMGRSSLRLLLDDAAERRGRRARAATVAPELVVRRSTWPPRPGTRRRRVGSGWAS